jgi:hypothetical protein
MRKRRYEILLPLKHNDGHMVAARNRQLVDFLTDGNRRALVVVDS